MIKSNSPPSVCTLLDPSLASDKLLANRVVIAPPTRFLTGSGLVSGPLAAKRYVQRVSAGLMIDEVTQISALAQGDPALNDTSGKDVVRPSAA
jgi:2,4-dienoyl-CoA reductase-like NADH-dependent reductase (Old Yellow Enzyme family)